MEIEAFNSESLLLHVLMALKVILLIVIFLTLAGFVVYLVGIVWFCFEETRKPARSRVEPATPARKQLNTNLINIGGTMKQKFLRTFSLLTFLLAGAFVTVQAQSVTQFTVDVPFGFTLHNQDLPAGKYHIHIRRQGLADHLRVSHAETKKSVIIFALPKETPTTTSKSKVIFRRYGNRYFLGEIWPMWGSGHEIARSKMERRLIRQTREDHLAVNTTPFGKTEIVALAGQ